MDGTCYNIAAGSRRIDLRIAACPGYGSTDGYTAWNQVRQLVVMEIVPRSQAASKICCITVTVFGSIFLCVFIYMYIYTLKISHFVFLYMRKGRWPGIHPMSTCTMYHCTLLHCNTNHTNELRKCHK